MVLESPAFKSLGRSHPQSQWTSGDGAWVFEFLTSTPDDSYTKVKNYCSQCYWQKFHHDNIGCNYIDYFFSHSHKMNFLQLGFTVSINFYILPLIPKEKCWVYTASVHTWWVKGLGKCRQQGNQIWACCPEKF